MTLQTVLPEKPFTTKPYGRKALRDRGNSRGTLLDHLLSSQLQRPRDMWHSLACCSFLPVIGIERGVEEHQRSMTGKGVAVRRLFSGDFIFPSHPQIFTLGQCTSWLTTVDNRMQSWHQVDVTLVSEQDFMRNYHARV
mgnify:CR=1 FL=1